MSDIRIIVGPGVHAEELLAPPLHLRRQFFKLVLGSGVLELSRMSSTRQRRLTGWLRGSENW